MVEPSDIDRMPDQDTQNLQQPERRTRFLSVGLKETRNDALPRETGNAAVAVLNSKGLDARDISNLSRLSKAEICRTAHIRDDQGGNGPRCGRYVSLSAKRELAR
jgi:hypothetical protein